MMSLLKKLELVAENQPEVYEAGAETFGATETKSGVGSVTLTNVHPVEHDITVQLPESKNLAEISSDYNSGVTIDDATNKVTVVGTNSKSFSIEACVPAYELNNKYVTLSMEIDNNSVGYVQCWTKAFYQGDGNYIDESFNFYTTPGSKIVKTYYVEGFEDQTHHTGIQLSLYDMKEDKPIIFKNIQLEIGETATEYKPCIDINKITVTDGTTNYNFDANRMARVKSVSPVTTLTLSKPYIEFCAEYFIDNDKLYEEGYNAGQESMIDESKLLPTTINTGWKPVVAITDVSEIPHEVTVNTSIANEFIKVYGKNLMPDNWTNANSWTHHTTDSYRYYLDLPAGTYTFSCEVDKGNYIYIQRSEDNWETRLPSIYWVTESITRGNATVEITENMGVCIWTNALTSTLQDLKWIQIEVGSLATAYEPYSATTYYADNEEGYAYEFTVPSKSPVMTFIPNLVINEGIYQVQYNKSYMAQNEYDRFWDNYQNYGNRTNYAYAFAGTGWNDGTFKPKYYAGAITMSTANNCFSSCKIADLSWLPKITITGTCQSMFTSATSLTHVGTIEFTKNTALSYMFQGATALHTIDKLIVVEGNSYSNTFDNCTALENITFDGVIGKNISFSTCPKLTNISLMSIINHLKDYSADTSGTIYTCTLGEENLAKLTDEEKAIATHEKGWTLA